MFLVEHLAAAILKTVIELLILGGISLEIHKIHMAVDHIHQTLGQKQSLEFWMNYISIQAENSIVLCTRQNFLVGKLLKIYFEKTHH